MEKHLIKSLLVILLVITLFNCKKNETQNTLDVNREEHNFGALASPNATYTAFQFPAGGLTGMPLSYDLTQFMPEVRNQGNQGSCVAFCLAYVKSYHERLEYGYTYSGNDKIMSPAFIYNQKKLSNDCEKAGTQTILALNFLKESGVCTEEEFPYDENNCSNQPSQTIKTSALKNKIREWQGFTLENNSNVIDEMKYSISQKQPIIIDYKIDDDFYSNSSIAGYFSWGTLWKQNDSGDPIVLGKVTPNSYHCSLLVGYEDSKKAFRLLNSWGKNWKDHGYCWVDYSWLLKRVRYAFVTFDEFNSVNNGNLEVIGNLDFGDVAVSTTSTKTIQLKNTGTKNIIVSSLSITSPYSSNWSNGTIQANATTNVNITFNPTLPGAVNKTLTINSDAKNNNVTIQASGNGIQQNIPSKIISLQGDLSYGNVIIGQSSSKTFTISNIGNSPLIISSISTPQGLSGSYSGTIQAGSSATVSIKFTPLNVQSYSGNITINSDATSGTNTISASGNGIQQTTPTKIISLQGDLSYGNVIIGQSSSKTFTISNIGNSPLIISSISTPQGLSGSYSGTIQAGSSATVSINFSPLNVQSYSGNITINSDATSGTNTISASGNGIQQTTPTKIISLSGNLSYGNITTGQTSTKTLKISNTGNSDLSVSSISSPQGFSGSFNGTIQAGNFANVSINFSPLNVQSYSGNIIVNSDATSGINTINTSGNGISNDPVVVPAIGTYGNCVAVGTYNCRPSYGLGTINAKIVSINRSTHQIVVQIKKCNGTAFTAGGKLNVVNLLCGGPNAVSYGFGSFSAGVTTFQMTIVDDNMVGSKAYVAFIVQGTSLDILYSAPTIVVTY